jgi:4-carboxymuconolactone decarboxylase
MAKMQEVYGWSVDPDTLPGDYVAVTVDHLFGTIWARPGLGMRDRRLLTIGVVASLGQPEILEILFTSAMAAGELDEAQLREVVLHLTHYIGWPLSTGVWRTAEKVIAARGAGNQGAEGS